MKVNIRIINKFIIDKIIDFFIEINKKDKKLEFNL